MQFYHQNSTFNFMEISKEELVFGCIEVVGGNNHLKYCHVLCWSHEALPCFMLITKQFDSRVMEVDFHTSSYPCDFLSSIFLQNFIIVVGVGKAKFYLTTNLIEGLLTRHLFLILTPQQSSWFMGDMKHCFVVAPKCIMDSPFMNKLSP